MKTMLPIFSVLLAALPWVSAQTGPFDPNFLPPTIDPNKTVHFVTVDGAFGAPSGSWSPTLQILSGGDQITEPITIGGYSGLKVLGNYLNIADAAPGFTAWADEPVIDILMQVYGDSAVLGGDGSPRSFDFLTGTLPDLSAPDGGSLPVEAKNSRWNWVLFRIENGTRPSDGSRFVGSIPANAQGNSQNGGVNGGTIRVQNVPGLIVTYVAFGQEGAFGEPADVNQFLPAQECEPEPETNLAFIDLNTGASQNLVVIDSGDQMVAFVENAGPAGDLRKAVLPQGTFMNFGITDNYLGLPCNEPRAVKICLDYYDDPELIGVDFGPEAYATDNLGSVAFVAPSQRQVIEGTGQWLRRSWTIPAVSLSGVNTTPLTGGPRLYFSWPVPISRFSLAVLRTGTHPLAGLDPLADCFSDPHLCGGTYGNYAEMDLHNNIINGLGPGTSVGDQYMIEAEAGPANDRRWAIRAAFDDGPAGSAHPFMNFAILDEALGPTSQPNAHLAICVTYYDDPALTGAQFRPEVYISERLGINQFAFTLASAAVTVEGTDQWRQAYWELPDVKFNGVNQGPQAAARFIFSGKVFFTRVAYAVIRPCGPSEGINLLAECRPSDVPEISIRLVAEGVELSWPASATGFVLEHTPALAPADWTSVETLPQVVDEQNTVTQPISGTRFYRLAR